MRVHFAWEGFVLFELGAPDPTGDFYTAGTELGLSNLRFRIVGAWGRSAGSILRSLGVSLSDDFALRARGFGVRLLSSLRLDATAAG